MSAQFTPGPWSVYRHFAAPEGSGYEVKGASRDDDIAEGMTLADATLIAAAPDLLEALDWLLASVTANRANEAYPGDHEERLMLARAAAEGAIAKATGGAA